MFSYELAIEINELRVLRGARKTLERCRPYILSELYPEMLRRVSDAPVDAYFAFLDELGYRSFIVDTERGGHAVDVLGSPDLLSNEGIVRAGNAALALNLLGGSRTHDWYLPTLADVPATGPASLADLTPGWVTPVMVLLFAVALAAAMWRGRRGGPLVSENLPVVVRAEETMEVRARLYQRS